MFAFTKYIMYLVCLVINMNFLLDTHTHTIASGHAYSTITEMVNAAKEKGLRLLGISEHAPAMPGSCKEIYFSNLNVFSDKIKDIQLLFGIETNVLDYKGNIDVSMKTLSGLNYGIASLHTPCITPGSRQENTSAYLHVMEHPYIHVIGHPDDSRYPVDYKALVKQAKETKVLLEVNNTSLSPNSFRANARENYKEMLSLCATENVPIIVNSDAHISFDVGNFEYAISLLKEIDFPTSLIANTSVETYLSLIKQKS